MPGKVRLVKKAARDGDLGKRRRWIALRDEFSRVVQADQEKVLMRRVAGDFAKVQRKMAAAHLRKSGKPVQGEIVRKIGFQALNGATNARRNDSGTQLSVVLNAHCVQHSKGQCARERLEVKRAMRALVFSFFHQKPAQSFRTLIDRKEMMPGPF